MINTASKIFSAFLVLLFPSLSFGQLMPIPEANVLSQNAFVQEARKYSGLEFELFKGQSFMDKKTGATVSAGWASKRRGDERMDCFLFAGGQGWPAAILFASARAETTWDCIGNPALTAKAQTFGRKNGLLVFALFEFQAPGGEIFKLPLAVEVVPGQKIEIGQLQECIERRTSSTPLTRLRQLTDAAKKCGYR